LPPFSLQSGGPHHSKGRFLSTAIPRHPPLLTDPRSLLHRASFPSTVYFSPFVPFCSPTSRMSQGISTPHRKSRRYINFPPSILFPVSNCRKPVFSCRAFSSVYFPLAHPSYSTAGIRRPSNFPQNWTASPVPVS